MKEALIRFLLKWLAGITAEQWERAVSNVIRAATITPSAGVTRADVWRTLIGNTLSSLPGWAFNLLRETAVAYAKRKGLIQP